VKVTGFPRQMGLEDAVMPTETGNEVLTIMVMVFEVAGLPDMQDELDVRMQDTRSLLAGVYVKAGLLVPALVPLTFHWYEGVEPPLTGVAVKVTGFPEQAGLTEAVMLTETGCGEFAVMMMLFELAGFGLGQDELDVRMQEMISPLTGVYEKIGLLVPEFTPFTFHWYWGPGPGFWGVAVKVTEVPIHTGLAEAVMLTETGVEFTTIVMLFEVAGLPVGQAMLDVRMQDTRSLFAGV